MVYLTLNTGALVLSSATLLLQSFAVVFPYWVAGKGARTYWGLWQSCNKDMCADLPTIPDFLTWVRTLEVFGMILITATFVCGVLKQYALKDQKKLLKAGAGFGMFSGMLILLGVVVFIGNMGKLGGVQHLHASFGLCIVAGVGAIASGILFVVWNKRSSVEEPGNGVVLNPVNY